MDLSIVQDLQGLLYLAFTVVVFGVEVFALVEAVRHRGDAYVRAGKRTKAFWASIMGGAALVGFLSIPLPSAILPFLIGIVGIVATGVFLADVRPALRAAGGGRPRSTRRDDGGW